MKNARVPEFKIAAAFRAAALAVLTATLATPSFAASSYYWAGTGSGATAGAPAGGNWDNSTTDWSTTAAGTPTTAWGAAGSTAVFGGKDGTYAVNVNATVNKPQILQFTNSGYTLANAATLETITFNGSGSGAAPNLQVASGKTAAIGANVTVAATTTCIWGNNTTTAGGELDILNGGTFSLPGASTIGMVGVGTLTSVKTGGQLTIGSGTGSTFFLGDDAPDNCTLSVDGGNVSFSSSGPLQIGGKNSGAVVGTLTVNGGSFSMAATNTSYPMTIGCFAGNFGTNNLNGGVLSVNQITNGAGSGYINFNGGVLKAVNNAYAAGFLNGLTAAYVRNGGAVVDNNGYAITIGQALLHSAFAGDNATDGGLIATNSGAAGSLSLTNANTYNGATIVKTGATLATTTASTGAGSYSVSNSATLQVQVTASGRGLAMSGLTLGTSGSDALTNGFSLGANASVTTPAVAVSGALNLNGTVTVNVTGSGLSGPNTYLLLSYGSSSGSGNFVVGSVPSVAGFNAIVTNNAAAGELELVYVAAPQPVKWAVGAGNWDTTSLNWQLLAGSGPTNYSEGGLAAFDDSASGGSPITVTLAASHAPSLITNNSSVLNYIVAGSSYNLTGAPLIKDGSGTLTLDNGSGNSFASISINSGALQVGNGDANGSLGGSAVANNGTLAFGRTDSGLVVANVISGSGGVLQSGSGAVTLSGANTYSGQTTIASGQLVVGNALALQNSPVANFAANGLGFASGITAVTIPGLSGTGSITLSNAAGAAVALTVSSTNLSTTFGGGLIGGTLVKQGTNTVLTLTNNSALVNLTVGSAAVGGTLLVTNGTLSVGDGTPGSSLQIAAGSGTASFFSGTLDVSAAAGFTANVGNFFVFYSPSGAAPVASSGTLALGTNNNITALTEVLVGEQDSNPTTGGYVTTAGFGLTTITTPLMNIAKNKASGSFTLGAGSTLKLSGTNGGRTALNIENQGASSPTSFTGTMDLTGGGTGVFNGVLSSLVIGNHSGANTGGSTGSATGSLLLSGSANNHLDISGAGNVVVVGGRTNSVLGIGTGTLTIGNLDATSSVVSTNNSTAILLGNGTNSVGTLNLNGGTLTITTTGSGIAGGSGLSTNNLNGVTLKAGTNSATFLSGLSAANVWSNGVSFDTSVFDITVPQVLQPGDANSGGLTKLGNGMLTLSGANTYAGTTAVSAGTLLVNGAIGTNIVIVNAAGTLGGQGVLGGNLTFASSSAQAYLYKTAGSPDTPLTVSNNLTLNGNTVSVDLGGTMLGTGTYTLLSYGGNLAGSFNSTPTIVNGSLAAGNAATIDLTTPNEVNLVVAPASTTPPGFPPGSISLLPSGNISLTVTGAPGTTYRLWASTNIAFAPATNTWTLLNRGTITASPFTNTDLTATNYPQRFYMFTTP